MCLLVGVRIPISRGWQRVPGRTPFVFSTSYAVPQNSERCELLVMCPCVATVSIYHIYNIYLV
jgi:hypothetical protein